MYLSILIFPLLGSFVAGLLGRKIGVTGAHLITCSCLIISSILATFAFYEVGLCASPVVVNLSTWMDSEILSIQWEFLFDQLTVSMFIPVLYISSLIHIFSVDYMQEDPAMCSGKIHKWVKLSNSGDTLKLIVPSSIRKYISGQNNYLGTVTSYKMTENEMGYRGSKSEFYKKIGSVKEQRVDGSWIHSFKQSNSILRYTLMAFERKYQTKNPSKQIVIPASFLRRAKNFSTYSQCKNLFQSYNPSIYPEQFLKTDVIIKKLEPWFVTGFTDAEGCFGFYLYKTAYSKTGWSISLVFQISLHEKDKNILEQIQNYFGVGGITSNGKTSLKYSVRSYNDMQKIIDHFDKYPLITNKLNDYKLFKLTYFLILQKEHLSLEGIKKLVLIKSSMNLGLSPELKAHFPDLTVQQKEKISDYKIKDPQWVAGFSSGEACFIVDINKSKSNQIGYSVNLRIMISQHARDELLLCSLINYINCGKLYKNNNSFNLTVRKFADIETKIIPFFIKYPILGNKFLDFQDFCKVSHLVKEKKHLQIDGFKKISLIKSGMNTKRI